MSKPRGILWDLDGVLVDACELHRQCLNKALAEHGYTITPLEHETTYNGLPTRVKLMMLTKEKGLPVTLHNVINMRKQELTMRNLHLIPFDPSKIKLMKILLHEGIQSVVCSNAIRGSVEAMIRQASLTPYFVALLGNEDVKNNKPAPDIYLKGAKELGLDISECVIVEDSPIGLEAAYNAKPMRVVHVSGPAEVTNSPAFLAKLLGE